MKRILFLVFIVPFFTFGQWTQVGTDINGIANLDYFGFSTSISNDGTIVAIGARAADGSGIDAGNVRVFENIAGAWTQIGSDIDGESAGDWFGYSISLNGGGNIIAIGAVSNDGIGTNSGHVRVFENIAGVWTQIGSDIDGEAENDGFGISVSLNDNGDILAVGASSNSGNGSLSGHVRVFENIANVWTQIGNDIDGEAAGDAFGQTTSLNSTGNIVAAGARNNDGNGSNAGHVRVFENVSGVWTQIGSDIDGEVADDLSGQFLDLNNLGNILAVGARFNDGNGSKSGHVRVFENIEGAWTQIGSDIDGEATGDELGSSVSLSSDGTILAVSANLNDGNGLSSGHVRVYENIAGAWTKIGSDIDGEALGDRFGSAVELSSNGGTIVIGGVFNDGNAVDSGHARVFSNSLLSIEENGFGPQFKAYPNPSNWSANIILGSIYQKVRISVFDVLGKEVMNKTYISTNKIELDTHQFTAGVYIVKVESDTKRASLRLVVK